MIDLNTIITQALTAAVQQAIAPLVEQITVLEQRIATLSSQDVAMGGRMEKIENNPAIGTDTVLAERVLALEQRMDHVIDASEKRIREIAEAAAEQVMEDHTSTYDHDDYDALHNEWGSEEVSDFVKDGYLEDQIEEKVKEVLNNASFSISI